LQRFKNEERRWEEGEKGHARMIPGEGGRKGGGYEGRGGACVVREGGKRVGWELPNEAPQPAHCLGLHVPVNTAMPPLPLEPQFPKIQHIKVQLQQKTKHEVDP
jgi:hypothetical protein